MAKTIFIGAVALLLAACGATGARENSQNTGFFMLSEGNVSLLHRLLTGGVEYCKVTSYNPGSTDFVADIEYDNGECTATITVEREVTNSASNND